MTRPQRGSMHGGGRSRCRGAIGTMKRRQPPVVLSPLRRVVFVLLVSSTFIGLSGGRVVQGFVVLTDGSLFQMLRSRSSTRSFAQGGGHRRRSRAAMRLKVDEAATSFVETGPARPKQLRSEEPPGRLLIHWRYVSVRPIRVVSAASADLIRAPCAPFRQRPRGEGVEGYSLQFRHLEFLGAVAAVSDGELSLDRLLRGCAAAADADAAIVAAAPAHHLSGGLRATTNSTHPSVLVSFENALSYEGGQFEDRVSPVKRDRYERAMQFVHFHDPSLRTALTRQLLERAVERCSLIHAMYEVVADSSSSSFDPDARQTETHTGCESRDDSPRHRERRYEELARNALKNGAFADLRAGGENERATWCLRVRQYGDPPPDDSEDVPRSDGIDLPRPRDRIPHLRHAGKKTRSMEKEREALLALRPLLGQLGGGVNLRAPDEKIYVFDGLANGTAVLARRLATGGHGRAASVAPNTRICVTNTPLCPVAAFALCNVAGVGGNRTVLDPYAGSGAILLAASLIDRRCRTVGIEIAHDGLVNREDLQLDFATRQLPGPVALIQGDSTMVQVRRQARAAIGNEAFDLIITDPPYGIRESTIQSVPVFDLLDSIASDREAGQRLLAKGGKLACFVPCQEDQSLESVLPSVRLLNDAGLRYESIREQPLNSKLSRWLVSFVCYR